MTLWLGVVAIGVATYGLRVAFLVSRREGTVHPVLQEALRFVPVAVLSALILPALLLPAGAFDLSAGNARLIAGILAAVVAWRTGSAVITVSAGMGALWILQAVLR
jgi:branched-subunit amino acid transport protein